MAKVSVLSYQYEKEPTVDVFEGDYDASLNDQGYLIVINNTTLKPSVKAIYAKGTWDRVTLDD